MTRTPPTPPTRRRARGEGSIRQRQDGRWSARVRVNGNRLEFYGDTQADVAKQLRQALTERDEGRPLDSRAQTLTDWLNEWFDAYQHKWSANTRDRYRTALDRHLIPGLGQWRLRELTRREIRRWLIAEGKRHGMYAHLHYIRRVLSSALTAAVEDQVVIYNAAKNISLPKDEDSPVRPMTAAQVAAFIDAARDHPLGALFLVTLATGLRLGEVCGLRWSDIDRGDPALPHGRVQVRQQVQRGLPDPAAPLRVGPRVPRRDLTIRPLKTAKSRRDLVLPPSVLEALRTHRVAQQAERLRAGSRWVNSGLVFTTFHWPHAKTPQIGAALHPDTVREHFRRILVAADLRPMRFHNLRHTAASLLMRRRVPLEQVSKLFGHSKMGITVDTYQHLMEESAAEAAAALEDVFAR